MPAHNCMLLHQQTFLKLSRLNLELLSIGCVCYGATVALHCVSGHCVQKWGVKPELPWTTVLCPEHSQNTTSTERSRGGVWKQISKSRHCCCDSAEEEVGLMREWEICPAPLWIWAVSLKDQLCPAARWPSPLSRLFKSFAKLGITFGLVLVNNWIYCCKGLGNCTPDVLPYCHLAMNGLSLKLLLYCLLQYPKPTANWGCLKFLHLYSRCCTIAKIK